MDSERLIIRLAAEVPFLRDSRIYPETRGHSRIPCFVVEKASQKFFLKVYPANRVSSLGQISEIYSSLQIPTAETIETSYLPDLDLTYCVYSFIEGPTLRELLRVESARRLEHFGHSTGEELGKFAALKGNPDIFFLELKHDLAQLLHEAHLEKRRYNQAHEVKKLPKISLQRLEKSLEAHFATISQIIPTFTHGDINLYNVIWHQASPYLIDTDGGHFATRALDFRGNCWWGWTGNNTEREQAVFRGIYEGYFGGHIPASFHQELGFAIMYEFLLRLRRYHSIDDQTYYSFLRWHDILELTNYFENYRFSWF